VGDELLHLKGVITTYIIHNMLSSLGAPSNNTKKKSRKAKRQMKKGEKKKVEVTHVSTISPPYIYTPKYVGIPHRYHP